MKKFFVILLTPALCLAFIGFGFVLGELLLPGVFAVSFDDRTDNKSDISNLENLPPPIPKTPHIKTPEPMKAVYMTACVAGTPSLRDKLVKLIDETEINAVIIDIKDYSGHVSFAPTEDWEEYLSPACKVSDMKEFLKTLYEKNIYRIGRVTVFQDPYLTKLHPEWAVKKLSDKTIVWKDKKGLSFIDPGAKDAWEHIINLAKDSHQAGFDEINFDYIRFPSDGNMTDIYFEHSLGKNKADVIESFFKHLHDSLTPEGIVMSADLFGMTTTNTDDLNIGQVLEKALPYFDYIAPMVYPSHYPPNFHGYKNPNQNVYGVVNFSMKEAVKRAVATTTTISTIGGEKISSTTPTLYTKEVSSKLKLRPWLQDFDYGGNYDIAEVKAQIQATYDAGLTSWFLWSPSNVYTRGALETVYSD